MNRSVDDNAGLLVVSEDEEVILHSGIPQANAPVALPQSILWAARPSKAGIPEQKGSLFCLSSPGLI